MFSSDSPTNRSSVRSELISMKSDKASHHSGCLGIESVAEMNHNAVYGLGE